MITQGNIDQNPSRTDKRYFIIETQLRSAVKPDAYMERLGVQPRFTLLQKQLIALFVVAATGFLLMFELGGIDLLAGLVK